MLQSGVNKTTETQSKQEQEKLKKEQLNVLAEIAARQIVEQHHSHPRVPEVAKCQSSHARRQMCGKRMEISHLNLLKDEQTKVSILSCKTVTLDLTREGTQAQKIWIL